MAKKRIPSLEQIRSEAAARNQQYELEALLQSNAETCEHIGDVLGAIDFYEQLVRMQFAGSNPYKRLCIIYHKQKAYRNELRVIECYRQVVGEEYFDTCQEGKYRWFRERKAKIMEMGDIL